MSELPSGTVTFLFTDVEGSTRLLLEHGDRYADLLAAHRRAIRSAISAHGGVETGTAGDAVFAVFERADNAVAAAMDAQDGLRQGPVRVRMGLHTGTPALTPDGYVGLDVHRAARIAAAGHGGQVLVSSATAELVDADLRDLGEHRLKDLGEPERIFQVGHADFPPLTTVAHTNLPTVATPLVGRERELAEVMDLVARDGVRVVTLTGPGGTGKTRLAIEAAAQLVERYPGGAWWVPLSGVRDQRLVLESLAQSLGIERALADHIGSSRMLVVFDNFEHVIGAAPDVAALQARCPALDVLVTSREPTHLEAEWEYRVDPLSEVEAVELFVERARAVERDFARSRAITAICRRLDCLPLAVELAAARVKVLSPAELLERLEHRVPVLEAARRDPPERQRTLEATIQWSYDLLSSSEQRLFAHLAVFAGGCSLAAAEDVVGADLQTLGSLIDKSLVRRSGARYWMLETIRDFARARLDGSGEGEPVRDRHAAWLAALAERAHPGLRAGQARAWFDRLEHEHANFRSALAWALERRPDRARAIAAEMWPFWAARGYRTEGRRWLEAALATDGADPQIEVELLYAAGLFALWESDLGTARRYADHLENLAECHRLPGAGATAHALRALEADVRGDHLEAVRLNDTAAALARANGDRRLLKVVVNNAGDALMGAGDLPRASARFREALSLAREDGDRYHAALALANLGYTAMGMGDPHGAHELLREALDEAHAIENRDGLVYALLGLGVLAAQSDPARGVMLIGTADALVEDAGGWHAAYEADMRKRAMSVAEERVGGRRFADLYAAGRGLSLEEAVGVAIAGGPTPQRPR